MAPATGFVGRANENVPMRQTPAGAAEQDCYAEEHMG